MGTLIPTCAHAQHWNLPAELTRESTQITFELDTTWHTVEGSVKAISGTMSLPNQKDSKTITATLTIPVASLDTESESRDEEMRDSMEESRFPTITVSMPEIRPSCDEAALTPEPACDYVTTGTITIRDVTLPLRLKGTISRNDAGAILVGGSTQLDWSKFGIKDPSILIAKVHEQVNISFHITLPKRKAL
jgi:polyisoprenoid-binding protein YceI